MPRLSVPAVSFKIHGYPRFLVIFDKILFLLRTTQDFRSTPTSGATGKPCFRNKSLESFLDVPIKVALDPDPKKGMPCFSRNNSISHSFPRPYEFFKTKSTPPDL